MKIEAGKYYKCDNGDKAFAGYVRDDCTTDYPVVGHLEGRSGVMLWGVDGRCMTVERRGFDLVEEWKEPAQGTEWINVYPYGTTQTRLSRENADASAFPNRIARIRVDWVEGQFDE